MSKIDKNYALQKCKYILVDKFNDIKYPPTLY